MDMAILDTNIVSYIMNGHSLASSYFLHLKGRRLVISFMTVAELYEGSLHRKWGPARRLELDAIIETYAVLPHSIKQCRIWGLIREQRRRQPIAVDDAWIAAAALELDCPLVTHNPQDFQGIAGLKIITEHM